MAQLAGRAPFRSEVCGLGVLRIALVSGVALTLLVGFGSAADAAWRGFSSPYGWYDGWYAPPARSPARKARVAPERRERYEPKKDLGFGQMPKGPLQIVVSIDSQKVTLFSNGQRVAQGPVSTGVPGHPTPMGVFSIIEKDRYHHSNIYSNAPMPFMERITWSGVALHEGVLPGHPASHGCIRMSQDFAQKLWAVTKLGVRVIVARNEIAPVEFEHPKLFAPKLKPSEPQIATNPATDGRSLARPTLVSQLTTGEGESDVTKPLSDVPPTASVQPSSADRKPAESAPPAAEAMQPAEEGRASAAAKPAETGDPVLKATGADEQPQPVDVAVPLPASDVSKPGEVDVTPAVAEPMPAEAAPSDGDVVKPAPSVDPAKPKAPRLRAAEQPLKRAGQVAVFVSRKEKRIFVRQGFVPLFDMPVVIDEPDQPLGTHVFTAMGLTDDGARMCWNVMTIATDPAAAIEPRDTRRRSKELPRPTVELMHASTAAQALERIQMPKEAVDRIGELLIPGSSLVVSDEGLGRETGRYTEFIVLTR